MWFAILGPVQAEGPDGRPVALRGPRTRALLTLLVVDAGKYVTADRLIDGMYDGKVSTRRV